MDAVDRTIEVSAYPFFASEERAATIRNNYGQVRPGMSPAEVCNVLGAPDEVRALYEPKIKQGKRIGTTHWYVIRRLVASGSFNDQQEALVRISYGLDDRVIAVDAWGL